MLLSSSTALLLAACWLLPAAVVVGLYAVYSGPSAPETDPELERAVKGIRAEIQQLDLEAPRQEWRSPDWQGPGAQLRARVQRSSYEVMILAPYAETTVRVGRADEHIEHRRCSLCLN